jgi:hypothetical protein
VYGPDGRLNNRFLLSTKSVLASVAGLADELRQLLPIPLDNSTSGISRMSAYIHLLYHQVRTWPLIVSMLTHLPSQCIVLATRPLLFCFLKIRLTSPESVLESLNSSPTVRNLLQICADSSLQMINILCNLQSQGLLGRESVVTDRLYLLTFFFLPRDLPLFRSRVRLCVGDDPIACTCNRYTTPSKSLTVAPKVTFNH